MTQRDQIVQQLKIAHAAMTDVNRIGNASEKHHSFTALVAIERMLVDKDALLRFEEPDRR